MYVGKLGLSATEIGELDARKWTLEVSGVAPERILIYMLKKAFAEKSQWLKEVAYRQVARLHGIPEEIAQGMREAIINLHLDGRLRRESYATRPIWLACLSLYPPIYFLYGITLTPLCYRS